MLYVGVGSLSAGVMALAVGFALSGQTPPSGPVSGGLSTARPGNSVFETRFPTDLGLAAPARPQTQSRPGMRLASLDPGISPAATDTRASEPAASSSQRASFAERFVSDPRLASFDDRFGATTTAAASTRSGSTTGSAVSSYAVASYQETREQVRIASLAPADLPTQTIDRRSASPLSRSIAPAAPSRSVSAPDKRPRPADAPKDSSTDAAKDAAPTNVASLSESPEGAATPSDADSRTAIYDISAHMVYLPNGDRLEAHSGLGEHMDDTRYIDMKGQGPTPPNVYKLTLRERSFHGVRAIRLIPVDGSKMFGRDGMLAHTYMLGPNGQSNGCVSFNDYQAFLNAFLKGEVDRLVVVEHLDVTPGAKTATGWLGETLKAIFGRS